jgi:hypothetical protein
VADSLGAGSCRMGGTIRSVTLARAPLAANATPAPSPGSRAIRAVGAHRVL